MSSSFAVREVPPGRVSDCLTGFGRRSARGTTASAPPITRRAQARPGANVDRQLDAVNVSPPLRSRARLGGDEVDMTGKLKKAFDEASRLPDKEQDELAQFLLDEIRSERQWSEAFARSGDRLRELAEEASSEDARGDTTPLDPDKL